MAIMMRSAGHIGSVLVVGGCGFIGYHVVRHLLLEPTCAVISVLSRHPDNNCFDGVSYHTGDITDLEDIRRLIYELQSSVIIHAACPSPTTAVAKTYSQVNIQGTKNLLRIAQEVPSAKAFDFISSATMATGSEHIDIKEDAPLADTVPDSHPYASSKAIADKLVLTAHSPSEGKADTSLLTACIRLPIVYGERDLQAIPGALAALEKGQTSFQLGDRSNLWDFVSVDNVAITIILLIRALQNRQPQTALKVDGEAFNITDGVRQRFWDFPKIIWKAAGHDVSKNKVRILPTRIAFIIAYILEWLFWIFTLDAKRPGLLGLQQVEYSCLTHTYRIDKARERLGYVPVGDFEQELRKAVAWSLDEGGRSSRLGISTL